MDSEGSDHDDVLPLDPPDIAEDAPDADTDPDADAPPASSRARRAAVALGIGVLTVAAVLLGLKLVDDAEPAPKGSGPLAGGVSCRHALPPFASRREIATFDPVAVVRCRENHAPAAGAPYVGFSKQQSITHVFAVQAAAQRGDPVRRVLPCSASAPSLPPLFLVDSSRHALRIRYPTTRCGRLTPAMRHAVQIQYWRAVAHGRMHVE